MLGSYGRSDFAGAYAGNPEKKCARLTTRYERLRAKGRNLRRLNRVKRRMDKACGQAQAATSAFETAYQAPAEAAQTMAAEAGLTSVAQASGAEAQSNLLPLLLVGGAAVLVLAFVVTQSKGASSGSTAPRAARA